MSRLRTVPAALRGVLGALAGAWLAGQLWMWAAWNLDFFGSLTILPLFLSGPAACLGYWLLRGLRNWKFARWTTYIGAFLGICLAVLSVLGAHYALALVVGIVAAFSAAPSQNTLLRYSDPVWYANPRRVACLRAGNDLYNSRLYDAPTPPLSLSFQVGVIHVSGETIHVEHLIRKGRTFSVDEVKGVIVGPSNGSNVLFDQNFQALAKFGASQKNGRTFVRYLEHFHIPLIDYRRSFPVEAQPSPAEKRTKHHRIPPPLSQRRRNPGPCGQPR